jgi:hypothetical protein
MQNSKLAPEASALGGCDPPLLPKTDPGGLQLRPRRQIATARAAARATAWVAY